jgi:hypothetical protein
MTTETEVAPINVGDVLANGARVIAVGPNPHTPREGYVLGVIVYPNRAYRVQYVSWNYWKHPGQPVATAAGHYFDSLTKAVEDFNRRTGGRA